MITVRIDMADKKQSYLSLVQGAVTLYLPH